jgi:hypothetical protein
MKPWEKADKCHCLRLFSENFTLNFYRSSINKIYIKRP